MAVALVQNLGSATGGSLASTLATTLGSGPGAGDTCALCVAWDANPAGGGVGVTISGVSGSLVALGPTFTQGNARMAFYAIRASAPTTVTTTFSGTTFASQEYLEWSGCAKLVLSATSKVGYGASFCTGNLPPTWAPLTGDLPYGFFTIRDAATATPQGSGWAQLDNLNHTAGQFAQLEVQDGPASITTPQSETALVTWANLSGLDANNIAALLIASASTPYVLSSQAGIEVIATDTANVRTSQAGVEIVAFDTANVRVSQAGVEVIYTAGVVPPPRRPLPTSNVM